MPDKVSGSPTLTKKPVADFSSLPVEPPVDPAARSYAARIQERTAAKASALKGKSPPLGHVSSPDPEKMAAIANLSAMPRPEFMGDLPPHVVAASKPEAETEAAPKRMGGVGSAYPVNQVIAQGKATRPVSLREGNQMSSPKSVLSETTVRALEEASQNAQQSDPPQVEKPSVASETKKELEDTESSYAPDLMDSMDYASLAEARSSLMSQKRRDAIEARLKPLEVGDMIVKRELTQTIPIIPNQLEVSLRTFTQRENLWVLKYIYDFPGSNMYIQELINTCRLVCSLVAVNGAYLPDHRKDVGTPNETIIKEDFEKKFFHVVSFPVQLVADLSVQAMWFQDRVDKLFTMDAIKNG